uniref:ZP domain-containing protein n=1 Tax=Plectus sambesii TaxID=2011161 RepID=A0A914W3C4_9BILA
MPAAASILTICALVSVASAFSINNGITERPHVSCEDTTVSIGFKTEKPFHGRVYARGLSTDYRCSRNFDFNKDATNFSMVVRRGDCNMKQAQGNDNGGRTQSMVIVVSFHSTFVTKVDRAYHVVCAYPSEEKQVTSKVVVGGISPTELMHTMPLPQCDYELHLRSPDGPKITFAKVGDPIVHVWKCSTNTSTRILVHSCMGTDGRGKPFFFYDRSGCAIDPIIMPDIEYEADGSRAFVSTWGFKFSDQNLINFDCAVETCNTETGDCNGHVTPPKCGRRTRRSKALLPTKQPDDAHDFSASAIILDDFNDAQMNTREEELVLRADNNTAFQLQSLGWNILREGAFVRGSRPEEVCLSRLGYSTLMAVIALLFSTSLSLVAVVCTRLPSAKDS